MSHFELEPKDEYLNLAKPVLKKLGIKGIEDIFDLEDAYDEKYWDSDEYSIEEVDDERTYQYREGDSIHKDEELERWKVEDPDDYEENVRKYDHLRGENVLEKYQEEEGMEDDPFKYDDRPLYVITEPVTYEIGHGCLFAENLYKNPSEYLSKGSSEKIAEAIKNSFNTAAEITMQVGESGGGDQEADWGCLWAYHQRGGEGVQDYWYQNYDPFAEDDAYFNSQEYINDGWD